jgi:PKD repeat protein
MPYVFGDPRGNPPYNYYLTYQMQGDPTYYRVEGVNKGAIQRFPDSGRPAWYSSTGAAPNPSTQGQYYITNSALWEPDLDITGNWMESRTIAGYYLENYLYTPAGQGNNTAEWFFTIPSPGYYNVLAWWSASPLRTSAAPYTITSASGETTVLVDQRSNGGKWNQLGQFYFNAGDYSVLLTDLAAPGNVVADAVRVAYIQNPPEISQVNFWADAMSGAAPLENTFTGQWTGDVTSFTWYFGDGMKNSTRNIIAHVYANPGTYTVTLTGSGPAGSSTVTKTGYIVVGGGTPFQAEFVSSTRRGSIPLTSYFTNRSVGNIVSWLWDFGDGTTSTLKNPSHTYTAIGNYTVKLTATASNGDTRTETKQNYIRAVVYEKSVDNVDYPKVHYGSKTILFRKDLEIPEDELKYNRMFYLACNSGNYFIDTFHRGVMYYSLNTTEVGGEIGFPAYLNAYFQGKTDQQIWAALQFYDAAFDYYNFNLLPSQQ